MNDITLRIRLEKRTDPTNQMTICPHVYDEQDGLMNYPVNLNEWKVKNIERFTGVKDTKGKSIVEGDKILGFRDIGSKHEYFESEIYFLDGAFHFDLDSGRYDLNKKTVQDLKIEVVI